MICPRLSLVSLLFPILRLPGGSHTNMLFHHHIRSCHRVVSTLPPICFSVSSHSQQLTAKCGSPQLQDVVSFSSMSCPCLPLVFHSSATSLVSLSSTWVASMPFCSTICPPLGFNHLPLHLRFAADLSPTFSGLSCFRATHSTASMTTFKYGSSWLGHLGKSI